jgi:hypothetical protein
MQRYGYFQGGMLLLLLLLLLFLWLKYYSIQRIYRPYPYSNGPGCHY